MTAIHGMGDDPAERNKEYELRAFQHPQDAEWWHRRRVRGQWVFDDGRDDRRWDHELRFDRSAA